METAKHTQEIYYYYCLEKDEKLMKYIIQNLEKSKEKKNGMRNHPNTWAVFKSR